MIDVVTVGRRRRLGGVALAGGHAQGRSALGGRRPRAALLRPRRHRADRDRRARGARPDPAAPARRRDPARRRRAPRAGLAGARRPARARRWSECATGILEISAWNQANALRQVTVQARPGRPRLHAGDLRRLRLAAAVPAGRHPRAGRRAGAPRPGQRLGVRAAHRRRPQRLRADGGEPARRPRPRPRWPAALRRPAGAGRRRRWTARASPATEHRYLRTADLRYAGQAFEVRVAGAGRAGRRGVRRQRWPTRSTTRTSSSTATRSATTRASRWSG